MRYFKMKQDRNLSDCIQMEEFDLFGPSHIFYRKDADRLYDSRFLYLTGDGQEARPDFLQSPVYLISDMVKQVVDLQEDDMIWKQVSLVQRQTRKLYPYFQLLLDPIQAVHPDTTYYPNGMEKHLILDRKKIGTHRVFLLEDSQVKYPVVHINVAESLLRRNLQGVILEEIEVK